MLVIVFHGQDFPRVQEANGVHHAPEMFVAFKTMRDAAQQRQARAVTKICGGTLDPVWNETLSFEIPEEDRQVEAPSLAPRTKV